MPALAGRTILVTGISDASSLALHCAAQLQREGARLVCTGLGPTLHHGALSERSAAFRVTGEIRHVDGGYHIRE